MYKGYTHDVFSALCPHTGAAPSEHKVPSATYAGHSVHRCRYPGIMEIQTCHKKLKSMRPLLAQGTVGTDSTVYYVCIKGMRIMLSVPSVNTQVLRRSCSECTEHRRLSVMHRTKVRRYMSAALRRNFSSRSGLQEPGSNKKGAHNIHATGDFGRNPAFSDGFRKRLAGLQGMQYPSLLKLELLSVVFEHELTPVGVPVGVPAGVPAGVPPLPRCPGWCPD